MRVFLDTAALIGVLALAAFDADAGQVRRITVTPEHPAEVRLAFGKTTVLSFNQRPENVVPGAPGQVHIEFLRNDINVSPMGPNPGNLVVYSKTARLVLLLKVVRETIYDDVVSINESRAVRALRLDRDSYRVEELKMEFRPKKGEGAPAFTKTIAASVRGDGCEVESEDLYESILEPGKFRCAGCRTATMHGGAIRLQCAKPIAELSCHTASGTVLLRRGGS